QFHARRPGGARERPRHERAVNRASAIAVWLASATATTMISVAAQGLVVKPGDPLPGITPTEFTEFRLGLEDFTEVEAAEEGLGPAFNATSCAACHSVPAIGGISVIVETRAAYRDDAGEFQGFGAAGDTLMHLFSTPQHRCQPVIPEEATIVA